MKKPPTIIIIILALLLFCGGNFSVPLQAAVTPPQSINSTSYAINAMTHSFPLSPAFNIVPLSPVHATEQLITEKLQKSLYSKEKATLIKDKIANLLNARRDGSISNVKEQSENIINTGILHIYASDFTRSAKEFNSLYSIFEHGEYLFYKALSSALYDNGRAKIEFSKYLRVARLQKEGDLWYNLGTILSKIIDERTIRDKSEYIALVKWFYDQYSFYTCFLMLKLYEKYVLITDRSQHDWQFIHTMNANLLIKSGNPLDAIVYLEKHQDTFTEFAPKLTRTLAILYYKTEQYEKAHQAFKDIPPTLTPENAYYYYLALLQFKRKEFTLFTQTFRRLKVSIARKKPNPKRRQTKKMKSLQQKNTNFTRELDELLRLNNLIKRFQKKAVSFNENE